MNKLFYLLKKNDKLKQSKKSDPSESFERHNIPFPLT